ncbi:MAG: hypothetical protein KJ905_00670 [Nanoarchaeota archaeon]|nr:hypothetical protein [Nanoarchaeota archaeon]MBU1501273.1 hypothetical protein [Nanoarchaeota archaeon]MBU2459381.1 hypothetical protein [Nanoarchaeota archaeon]
MFLLQTITKNVEPYAPEDFYEFYVGTDNVEQAARRVRLMFESFGRRTYRNVWNARILIPENSESTGQEYCEILKDGSWLIDNLGRKISGLEKKAAEKAGEQ